MTRRREQGRAIFLAAIMAVSMIAMGAAGFAGTAAANVDGDIGVVDGQGQNISIGSQPAELDRLTLNDTAGGDVFGDETVLSLDEDSGVTWADVERVRLAGTDQSVSISDDGTELIIDHGDQSSDDGDNLRVIGAELNVDADADIESVDLGVDYLIGDGDIEDFFEKSKPALDGDDEVVSLGALNQSFVGEDINVSTQSDAGEIGDEVILTAAEDNGITWNETIADRDIILDDSGLNVTDISVTDNELSVSLADGPSDAEDQNVSFDAGNLTVNVAGDATNSSFGAEVVPVNSDLRVELDETYDVDVTSDTVLEFDESQDLAVGSNNQGLSGADEELNLTDTTGDNIGDGTNVTISTDSEYVSINETNLNESGSNNINVTDWNVIDGAVELLIGDDSNAGDSIVLNETTVDIAADAPNETVANFTATTQSSSGAEEVTVTDEDENVTALTPSAQYDDVEDDTLWVDNTGVVTPGENILVNATTDDQFGLGENATINFDSDTGVSFNESALDTVINSDADLATDGFVFEDDSSAISFNITGAASSGDGVNISSVALDVEATAEDNTLETEVPTNDSSVDVEFDGSYDIQQATVDTVDSVSDDNPSLEVGDEVANTANATNSSLARLDADDPHAFGGADLELELTDQPENADLDTSDVIVGDTTLTTDEEGKIEFNFTADTTGSYDISVNSTDTDDPATQVFTFDVTSGEIDSVSAEGAENAFRGGASDLDDNLQTGVYKVDLTDENDNPVTQDEPFEFRVTLSGSSSELIGLTDDLADEGTGTDATSSITPGGDNEGPLYNPSGSSDNVFVYNATDDDTDEPGTFYVYVGNDVAEDIDVEIIPRGESSEFDPDTGTTTFFGSADSIDLSVDETVTAGEFTDATATVSTSAGDVIEVPRIDEDFESDNTTVIDIEESEWTNNDGEAIANLSAVEAGTANLTAELRGLDTSTEITVVEEPDPEPANFQVSNVSPDGANVTFGESIDVTADVENIGDEDGTQTVEFRIDLNLNGTLEEDEEIVNQSVSLNSSESTEVVFEDIDTSVLENETYTHGVFSSNDSATATITVVADEDDDGDAGDGDLVEAPGGVTIPSKYVSDGIVNSGGLGDAAFDFRAGDIDSGTLGDVALAFRES